MAGTKDIKRQIVSVQNTQKVTKAMKMVSAAKMRKANEAMFAARPYAAKIREVVESLSSLVKSNNPFLQPSTEVKSVALLLVNSDRGLCGAFNSNVVRSAVSFIEAHKDKSVKLYIVGKNAFNFYKKRPYPIVEKWITLGGKASYGSAQEVSGKLANDFLAKEFDELYIIYNEFRSVAFQVAKTEKLFPLSFEVQTKEPVDYIFEPSSNALLDKLVPKFIDFTLYHVLLESAAGEHGARMVAMDNATRSADDMIKRLVLNFNKARQASITTDLLDIVNGAEALKG